MICSVVGWWTFALLTARSSCYLRESFNGTWPRSEQVDLDGDVMLGALMMVHERENEPQICGEIMPQGGVQALEAMLFTLDYVNKQQIVPHTKLGALILDDCDKDSYGLEQAIHFIRGNIKSEESDCTRTNGQSDVLNNHKSNEHRRREKPITGVIAAASSMTSIQVANLLKLFRIPQVSYFSTSADLQHQERYNFFFRTIPSDDYQVEAMVNLIELFGWNFVSVVYEESSYGKVAFHKLEQSLMGRNKCLAAKELLPKDTDVAGFAQYREIVKKLNLERATAVVVYGSDQEVHQLMQAVHYENLDHRFTWIGSDGWSARELVYKGASQSEDLTETVLGTISVQPMAAPIPGFREYFEKLTVHNHQSTNPWFFEFWEKEFHCRYPGFAETPYNNFTDYCTGEENIGHKYDYEKQLQFVSDAVLVFAHALRKYLLMKCDWDDKECIRRQYPRSISDPVRINGTLLRDLIKETQFSSLSGQVFKFFGNGAPPRYNIIHFRKDDEGVARWMTIGNFTEHGLKLDESMLRFYTKEKAPTGELAPKSVCSVPCREGQRKTFFTTKCCWDCTSCKNRDYLLNETSCGTCRYGTKPNAAHTRCEHIPIETVQPFSIYGIVCIIVAFLGLSITVFIFVVFLLHNDTPIVKASGRELSYVILCGLFMCFGMTAVMLSPPNTYVCGLQRFMAGFCFTVVYAALLTKTNRIARIFRAGKRTTRRPSCISPESQLLVCGLIVVVQIVIAVLWLLWRPPQAIFIYPTENDNRLVCKEAVEFTYLITYTYPILLCIICTVYAIQTRNIPEAFNESKHIGAAVYTTCVIWLAFVPIYFVVKENIAIRVTCVCLATSLTAVVCQMTLFFPKLYIILLRPERNVRQSMMGPKGSLGAAKTIANAIHRTTMSSDVDTDADGVLEPLSQSMRSTLSINTATQTTSMEPLSMSEQFVYIDSNGTTYVNCLGDIQL